MSKYLYGAVALSSLALIGLTGCKRGQSNANPTVSGNVGTVNGNPITYDEFYSFLQHKPVVQVILQGQPVQLQVAGTLGGQAVEDLVRQELMVEIAKEDGVAPTDEDVTKELDERKKQNANYIQTLEDIGMSLDDIRYDLKIQLASEKILTKGVTVTEAEAKQYIAKNKKAFSKPAQAKILLVVVDKAADEAKVDSELKAGQTFETVAMKYSTAPNARQTGAMLPYTDIPSMPPQLQQLVNATAVGKTTDWKKNGQNWVKFLIKSKTPAKPMDITPDVLDTVRRAMAKNKGKAINEAPFEKMLADKIRSAKVELSIPQYQKDWASFAQVAQTKAPAPTPGH